MHGRVTVGPPGVVGPSRECLSSAPIATTPCLSVGMTTHPPVYAGGSVGGGHGEWGCWDEGKGGCGGLWLVMGLGGLVMGLIKVVMGLVGISGWVHWVHCRPT